LCFKFNEDTERQISAVILYWKSWIADDVIFLRKIKQ